MTEIQVIGAGLPRTGTLTQKLALEELGFTPCYHWVNLLMDLDTVVSWDNAMSGTADWHAIFGDSLATVDWPGGYFYRELMETYPQAKVLLSVRDPQKWERSFRDTIWTMCFGESLMPLLSRARAEVDPRWRRYLALVERMFWGAEGTFSAGHAEPEALIAQMERHTQDVISTVPPERLLVWDVNEGWEPLCAFLEVDIPASPLPHANDRDSFVLRVIGGALDALETWRESNVQLTT